MPRGGKGLLWHYEAYEGPDTPFKPGLEELPTLTCFHCNRVVVLNTERRRDRARCWNCNAYICDVCNAVYLQQGCHPIAQALELAKQFPNADISLARGDDGRVFGDEIALAERTKPYRGIDIPSGERTD